MWLLLILGFLIYLLWKISFPMTGSNLFVLRSPQARNHSMGLFGVDPFFFLVFRTLSNHRNTVSFRVTRHVTADLYDCSLLNKPAGWQNEGCSWQSVATTEPGRSLSTWTRTSPIGYLHRGDLCCQLALSASAQVKGLKAGHAKEPRQ